MRYRGTAVIFGGIPVIRARAPPKSGRVPGRRQREGEWQFLRWFQINHARIPQSLLWFPRMVPAPEPGPCWGGARARITGIPRNITAVRLDSTQVRCLAQSQCWEAICGAMDHHSCLDVKLGVAGRSLSSGTFQTTR